MVPSAQAGDATFLRGASQRSSLFSRLRIRYVGGGPVGPLRKALTDRRAPGAEKTFLRLALLEAGSKV